MRFRKLLSKIMVIVMILTFITSQQSVFAATKKVYVATQAEMNRALKDSNVTQIVIKTSKKVKLTIPDGNYSGKRLYLKAPSATVKFDGDDFKSVHTYVSTQAQLNNALKNANIDYITITTSKKIKLTIPKDDYSDKGLYINASAATVVNKGDFKAVTAYVSTQEALDRVLKNSRVTIISITTETEEEFIISKDYPDLKVIVNAPNSTFTATGVLGKVDVQNAKEVTLPKEQPTEQPTSTPTPTNTPEDTTVIGGGGGSVPSVPETPSIPWVPSTPSEPTEAELLANAKTNAINIINNEASKYDTTRFTDSQTKEFNSMVAAEITKVNNVTALANIISVRDSAISSIRNFVPTPITPSEPTEEELLATSKEDAINSITEKANEYLPSIPDSHKAGFEEMINNAIDRIIAAVLISEVTVIFEGVMSNIETYYVPDMSAEELLAMRKADYQKFLDGNITIQELYNKYAKTTDGYEVSISPDVNETGLISLYLPAMYAVVIVDVNENITVVYDDNSAGYYTGQEGYDSSQEIILEGKPFYPVDVVQGMIVYYNNTAKSIVIDDLTTLNTTTITTENSSLTKWQDLSGNWYFGFPTNLSSLDEIRTENGLAEVSTSAVSGSAITFKLYMNNTEGVNRICFAGTADILNVSYYTVTDNGDNTSVIEFNNQFVQDYIMTKTEDTKVQLYLFPTETTSNGTGLTFDITVDHTVTTP